MCTAKYVGMIFMGDKSSLALSFVIRKTRKTYKPLNTYENWMT